jgi:hypothetical protein
VRFARHYDQARREADELLCVGFSETVFADAGSANTVPSVSNAAVRMRTLTVAVVASLAVVLFSVVGLHRPDLSALRVTFDSLRRGHLGGFGGTIGELRRLEVWDKPHEPMNRPSWCRGRLSSCSPTARRRRGDDSHSLGFRDRGERLSAVEAVVVAAAALTEHTSIV